MYKLLPSSEPITQINAAAFEKWNQVYCLVNANAKADKWAIPITEHLSVLNCDFITDEWLTTDLVDALPADWAWHLPEKNVRISIDNKKLASELFSQTTFVELILAVKETYINDGQVFTTEEQTFIYLAHIDSQYQSTLDDAVQRGTIRIEYLNS